MEASPLAFANCIYESRTLGRAERVTGSFYFRRDVYRESESLQEFNYSPYSPSIINLKKKRRGISERCDIVSIRQGLY